MAHESTAAHLIWNYQVIELNDFSVEYISSGVDKGCDPYHMRYLGMEHHSWRQLKAAKQEQFKHLTDKIVSAKMHMRTYVQ